MCVLNPYEILLCIVFTKHGLFLFAFMELQECVQTSTSKAVFVLRVFIDCLRHFSKGLR